MTQVSVNTRHSGSSSKQHPASGSDAPSGKNPGSGRELLRSVALVEDDPCFRGALHRLLVAYGFEVTSYPTAEDFLANHEAKDADCLILDVHLPGMSGPALAATLIRGGRDIPTVFISASARAARLVFRETGRPGILLRKPFDGDQLLSALVRQHSEHTDLDPTVG